MPTKYSPGSSCTTPRRVIGQPQSVTGSPSIQSSDGLWPVAQMTVRTLRDVPSSNAGFPPAAALNRGSRTTPALSRSLTEIRNSGAPCRWKLAYTFRPSGLSVVRTK
ncbi:hypothetical protein D9M72_638150 [compost metagenome]